MHPFEIIITSTKQEIEEQWRLYDGFDLVLECKLRVRIKRGVSCHGGYMPRMVVSVRTFSCLGLPSEFEVGFSLYLHQKVNFEYLICIYVLNYDNYFQVIPPGMEFHHIIPHDGDMDGVKRKMATILLPMIHPFGQRCSLLFLLHLICFCQPNNFVM